MRSATQGHLATDRHALTQLELRDRLLRLGHDRLLARQRHQFRCRHFDLLLVLGGFTDTHVDDDLLDLGNLHVVLVTELFRHRRLDALVIESLHARLRAYISH
jgi:hypothetical protein